MKYYTDKNNNLLADPINIEVLTEVTNPIRADGTVLPNHSGIVGLERDTDGKLYKYYNQDCTPDTARIDLENYKAIVAHGESLVKGVVQAEIKKYNEANGVNFESINNCKLYENDLDHPHQPFCVAIIAYNSLVWREARRIQEQISTGAIPMPTDQGFIDMLPKFV